MADRAVIVELHDVAPQAWADYAGFVSRVDTLGGIPLTWLVVPNFHHQDPLEAAPDVCRLLDDRLVQGDELVLHGFCHRDDAPPPRSPREWFMRRVFTREGEFACLDEAEAQRRLKAGIALFRWRGWPLDGFVGPGWLLSDGARRALARSGLRYTADAMHIYQLPEFGALAAPTLVWSAGRIWRRRLSRVGCEAMLRRHGDSPLIRLALHPEDMRHDSSRDYWLATLERLVADGRRPTTMAGWLRRNTRLASQA